MNKTYQGKSALGWIRESKGNGSADAWVHIPGHGNCEILPLRSNVDGHVIGMRITGVTGIVATLAVGKRAKAWLETLGSNGVVA